MTSSVTADEKAAILAHYTAQAAEANTYRPTAVPVLPPFYPYNHPEAPEEDDTASGLRMLIDDVQAMLGRAERCIDGGDYDAAIDMLHSAGRDLAGACHEA